MSANLTAIGKFSSRIVKCLEYPAYWYEDFIEGQDVITELSIEATNQLSELAEALGVGSLSDLHRHKVDPSLIDWNKLNEVYPDNNNLNMLIENGFTVFFRPNC